MSKSPTLDTAEGRAVINQAVDMMIRNFRSIPEADVTPENLAFQAASGHVLFTHEELSAMFAIAIMRLAGHDTNA